MSAPLAWAPDRLELGEGSRWVDGRLYLVDIMAGRLLAAEPQPGSPLLEVLRLDVPLGAVAPVAGQPGTWLAAAGTGIALLRPTHDRDDREPAVTWLASLEEDDAALRVNDAVADAGGRFWVGTMAYATTPGAGSLYRMDGDTSVRRMVGDLTIPNGPAFDRSGTTMYLADSARGIIDRFDVDAVTGELSGRERFVELGDASPDGMTVDADGHLWVAVWGTSTARRYRPDGGEDHRVSLPALQPSSVCLGDGHLFVTTATVGLASPGPRDGLVFSVGVGTGGFPAHAARLGSEPG